MEEKKSIKISLSTFLLILSIIIMVVMGIFICKLNNDKLAEIKKANELQTQINKLRGTVSELQEKINKTSETVNKESSTTTTNENNELYIVKEINISGENNLYNFKTKKWVKEIVGAEGMYYIAIDNEKNIYIVDRFENILKKLDAKLEKLNIDDTNVDNHITYANVSEKDNTLVISTEDYFITYIVSLDDLSTKLAEINDH